MSNRIMPMNTSESFSKTTNLEPKLLYSQVVQKCQVIETFPKLYENHATTINMQGKTRKRAVTVYTMTKGKICLDIEVLEAFYQPFDPIYFANPPPESFWADSRLDIHQWAMGEKFTGYDVTMIKDDKPMRFKIRLSLRAYNQIVEKAEREELQLILNDPYVGQVRNLSKDKSRRFVIETVTGNFIRDKKAQRVIYLPKIDAATVQDIPDKVLNRIQKDIFDFITQTKTDLGFLVAYSMGDWICEKRVEKRRAHIKIRFADEDTISSLSAKMFCLQ